MSKIKLHKTAIAILEAIELAEKIKDNRLNSFEWAINYGDCWYKKKCIDELNMSDRVVSRLESRYAKHLKKMGI